MKENKITITYRADDLSSYTDEYIQNLWHVAQANSAPHGDEEASKLVKDLLYEITRRWLGARTPALYSHQPDAHYWRILANHGSWRSGQWQPGEPAIKPDAA